MPVSFYPAKHPAKPIELSELQGNTPLSILRGACYDQYEKSGEILQSSFRDQEPILARSNGFVNALTDAYNQHRALSIRPDDVWIAILAQFSFFVNTNAERIRAHFVEYEGQKELTVTTIGTRYTVDFGQLAKEMTEQIRANIKDQALCDWILPDFSTTTLNDTVVSSVVMMATLQKYFSYSKMLRCGIPKVTLEGEKADWEKLLARVDKLKEYGDETTKWFTLLHPVLSRFVAAFDAPDSQENIEFWQRVAHYKRGASGPRYVSGWMTAFCVFDEDGKWLAGNVNNKSHLVLDGTRYHSVDTKKIPPGYASVPVKLDDNGKIFDTIMVAGMVGIRVDDSEDKSLNESGKQDTIRPVPGWWIFIKRDENLPGRGAEEQQKRLAEVRAKWGK